MDQGSLFRRWFHEELDALDRFFEEGVREKELSFGTDDPDMRRIVEAMAFFSARTRAMAASSMRAAIVRMAGGLLDDLFAPMPAVAMLRASGEKLVDGPMELPRGTRFRVETPDRRASLFVTKEPLIVRPISIEKAEIARSSRGAELRMSLAAAVPQKGQVDLPLFVRRHGDHRAAAELKEALARCFLHATAKKDNGVQHRCAVSFTAPAPERPWDEGEDGSPLGRIRSHFHAPEQDLFLRVSVPAEGGAFRRLDLVLQLDADFPEELTAGQDTFALFVVPAENAWTDLAEPIPVDGTAEPRPVRPAPSALDAVEPVLVRGVYRPVGKTLSPLPPRSLAEDGPSYEVLFPEGDAPLVRIACPEAVARPWPASVDAVWSQPSLWANARGPLSVRPQRKKLEGVQFRVMGNVRPPAASPLALSPEKGLDLMALRQKPTLDHRDLRALLELLGASGASPFARFPGRIAALTARHAPDPLGGRGSRKRVYQVEMKAAPPDEQPLSPAFHRQVTALLDAWSTEAADVQTTVPVAGGPELLP